jgi:endogenous inhibitor of DNA gyrase (YacG/DUF329 family)
MEPPQAQKEKCPQCGIEILSAFRKKIIFMTHDDKIKTDDMVFCSIRCASNHQMSLEG